MHVMPLRGGFLSNVLFSGLLLVSLCLTRARGQEGGTDIPLDGKTYTLDEVVITATRSLIPAEDAPSQVDVITRTDIGNSNGTTVADVLENTGSAFLQDYGGNASKKTLSVRGSAASHLIVLVDGNRLNSYQNGEVDLSLLPLNTIERIEFVRGGSSALYGADALGGVVNILTRRPSGPVSVRTEATLGSFGYERYLVEVGGKSSGAGFMGGVSSERGRDDYPFRPGQAASPVDSTLYRENADFTRRQVYLSADALGCALTVHYLSADRGLAGLVTALPVIGAARQSDDVLNLSASYARTSSDLDVSVTTGYQYSLEQYVNVPYLSYYKNGLVNINPQVRLRIGQNENLLVGSEFSQAVLQGNDFDSEVRRTQKAVYLSSESHFSAERQVFDKLSLYQTLRYDNLTDAGFALTPKVGLNVRITREGDLRFRASLGQNFRAPSFNDLYYRGFSNPNLQPEHSTSADVSFSAAWLLWGEHAADGAYFYSDTKDRILLTPAYLPENIGKVVSQGVELRYQGELLKRLLHVLLAYSYTEALKKNRDSINDQSYNKQIIYTPRNIFTITVSVDLRLITVNVVHSLTGKRYTRADDESSLPAYSLTGANVLLRREWGTLRLTAKAEVTNIFGTDYQVIEFYPMPQRGFRLGLGLEY